jgi:hypothetical protein
MATATGLASLKFTAAKKVTQVAPVQLRRTKLCAKIDQQIAMATAFAAGAVYTATKTVTVVDAATGEQRTEEKTRKARQWWFKTDGSKLALQVKYGSKCLALNSKGLTAIEVASASELASVLAVVREAVDGGELDAAMDAASGALRKGFGK